MTKRCGLVAIVGRPNVGKSTLLNSMIRQKISITSPKPQTTRHRILGIQNKGDAQIVFVDTPGLHLGGKRAINRYMNRVAAQSVFDVDVILWVVEALRFTDEDEAVLANLRDCKIPIFVIVNKIDRVKEKDRLLPFIQELSNKTSLDRIVPLAAIKGDQVEKLEELIIPLLPEGEPMFAEDMVTDRSQRFLAAEIVREKLMRTLNEELPYETTVEIESFKTNDKGHLDIAALIWVERDGQKAIVIGKGGDVLKKVGTEARKDMERLFDNKVFLQLWVRVKTGWSDDERALKSLGYGHDDK